MPAITCQIGGSSTSRPLANSEHNIDVTLGHSRPSRREFDCLEPTECQLRITTAACRNGKIAPKAAKWPSQEYHLGARCKGNLIRHKLLALRIGSVSH